MMCVWQGLPAWNLLLLARRPYAVPLRNCADIPAVLAAAGARVSALLGMLLLCLCFAPRHMPWCPPRSACTGRALLASLQQACACRGKQ